MVSLTPPPLTPSPTPVAVRVLVERVVRASWVRCTSSGAGVVPAVDVAGAVAALAVHTWVVAPLPPIAWALPLVWLVLLAGAGAYRSGRGTTVVRTVGRAGAQLALGCAVASVVLEPTTDLGRMLLLTGAATAVSATQRATLAAWRSTRPVPVVVAGEPAEVARMLLELRRGGAPRWQVTGVCLPDAVVELPVDVPVTVGLERLPAAALSAGARVVVVAPGGRLDPPGLRRVAWALESTGVDLYVGTGLLDVSLSRARLVGAGGLRVLHLRPAASRGPSRWVKEVLERTVAVLLLAALLPLLLGIGLAVRHGSAGPAVFRQVRVGRGGREFVMLKFRTMTDSAEHAAADLTGRNECADGVLFKIRRDPRVTRLGGTLRRYSLDELPQLVNVVRGDMSLVGPRPALPSEVSAYDGDPTRRLAVKPGLTGLWQVSGRSDLSWEQTVRLDLAYVDNWSLGLDLAILGRTVRAVLGHRGAY